MGSSHNLRILVLGSGGREHALVWKFQTSLGKHTVFCVPGNAGIQKSDECPILDLDPKNGFWSLLDWVERQRIDLTVVGPEMLLADGIVDAFHKRFGEGKEASRKIFGPSKKAAQLETSKIFAKEFLRYRGIPTAQSHECQNRLEVLTAVETLGFPKVPVVLKADGLASGKGVWVCTDEEIFQEALRAFFEENAYGAAGKKILVEEFLEGEEVSFLAICDGKTAVPLATSQDHKRIFDGDRGPNTGGMGAYSPAPAVSAKLHQEIMETIIFPTLAGMREQEAPYSGILYAGLMLTAQGPKVLEFNCRFGDPETQAVLVRLKTDLAALMQAAIAGELEKHIAQNPLIWDPRPAVCVVMASQGYPAKAKTGDVIHGLEKLDLADDRQVFHAGTAVANGKIVTSGGRVLGVTAMGEDLGQAIEKAYGLVKEITWAGAQYRHDIGKKGLRRGQ